MQYPLRGKDNPIELIAKCPLCNSRYNAFGAKMLKESSQAFLWHLSCRNCSNAVMLLIEITEQSMNSVGLVTDLISDDALQLEFAPVINANDCISLHTSLEDQEALMI